MEPDQPPDCKILGRQLYREFWQATAEGYTDALDSPERLTNWVEENVLEPSRRFIVNVLNSALVGAELDRDSLIGTPIGPTREAQENIINLVSHRLEQALILAHDELMFPAELPDDY